MEFGLYNVLEMKELLIKAGYAGLLFFAPIHTLMFLITCAIIIDTFFGRWAAAHKARQEGIPVREAVTSSKTRKGIIAKFIGYNGAIIFTFLVDKFILHEIVLLIFPGIGIQYLITKIVALLIIWIEFDSIDESWYRVKGVTLKSLIIKKLRSVKSLYNEFKKPQE